METHLFTQHNFWIIELVWFGTSDLCNFKVQVADRRKRKPTVALSLTLCFLHLVILFFFVVLYSQFSFW